MDMTRELQRNPPKRPLTTTDAVVEDFEWRFPRSRRDMVLDYCKNAPNLEIAIKYAVESKDVNGKMHNHQSRVRYTSKNEYIIKLLKVHYEISEVSNFDDLYDICAKVAVWGISLVTIYDVATRIGAYLNISPTSVYLHAGVRQGWYAYAKFALSEEMYAKYMPIYKKADRLASNMLPTAFREIPADDVEDILCTYRNAWGYTPSR